MSGGTLPTCQRLGGIWIASLMAKGSLSLVRYAAVQLLQFMFIGICRVSRAKGSLFFISNVAVQNTLVRLCTISTAAVQDSNLAFTPDCCLMQEGLKCSVSGSLTLSLASGPQG